MGGPASRCAGARRTGSLWIRAEEGFTELRHGAGQDLQQRGRNSQRDGRGLFASALLRRFPTLPVEEEGRLNDPALRENFIERIFAYRRLKDLSRRDGRSARS